MQERFDIELRSLTAGVENPLILVGVSGGMDSMCMANLFLNTTVPCTFRIAHVNFSLRGVESDLDEEMVRDWCKNHGVIFYSTRVDAHKFAQEQSISTQMAARDLRYEWFFSLLKEQSMDFVAISHNLNDSVETLMINLLRGTGLRGLTGIPRTNGPIIRPLLSVTRSDISDYVISQNIPYREDFTNKESHYHRNRIRNEVFPHFEKINPSFLQTISTSMTRFSEISEVLDQLYKSKEGSLYRMEEGVLQIDIKALKSEKSINWWLYMILEEYGFNETQMAQIAEALKGQSGKTFLSPTHILVKDRKYLKVYSGNQDYDDLKVSIKVFAKPVGFDPKKAPEGTLYVDGRLLKFPLKCRRWQPADRFRPFGMKGFKKLSDFFIDLKLDVEEKKRQIVVTTLDKKGEEQIVCIVGKRIDDRWKITAATKQIVSITKV
ncbi:MAG: tRNA lysidine(34) synthetase TilS [Bacteroidales bacterium]|nr:tRNA lysidine(34) synthetase TilS [Bacteroidales bacterium]